MTGLPATRLERSASVACGIAAVAALALQGGRFFPAADGVLGHDYAYFLPHLILGANWFAENGVLEPPYYTPAFCGGMPWLGNPQSIMFSLPQLLVAFLDPIRSLLATLVVSAIAGAAGVFGLLRYRFHVSASAATLGAVLWLLHGFLIYRIAAGHISFHVVSVSPVAAWVLTQPRTGWGAPIRRARSLAWRGVLGGCLIAYTTYGGALHLTIPVVLSVACAVLLLQLGRGFRAAEWVALSVAGLWAALICAMKLAPATVLAAQFPRTYLPTYLFDNVAGLLTSLGLAFFAPELLPDGVPMGTDRATLGRHEYEFGLSVVPALLLLLGCWRIRFTWGLRNRCQLWLGAALCLLLLVPAAVTYGPEWWGAVLLDAPILRNNTTLVRWWLIYTIPIIVVSTLSFDRLFRTPAWRAAALTAAVAVVIGQSTVRTVDYYTHPEHSYDPGPALAAHRSLRAGQALPPISRIGRSPGVRDPYLTRNNAFLSGASAWPCYDGLFGYWVELLPELGLREGPALEVAEDGRLNLIDPESYLRAAADLPVAVRFAAQDVDLARAFASYQPLPRPAPFWQRLATTISVVSVIVSALALVAVTCSRLVRGMRGRAAERLDRDDAADSGSIAPRERNPLPSNGTSTRGRRP